MPTNNINGPSFTFSWEKYLKCLSYFLILSMISIGAIAQQKRKADFKFKTLTSKDGMSSSHSRCLAQDEQGLIWIGTNDGLNVFNGYEFKNYVHTDTSDISLGRNFITALFFDNQKRLWVGSHRGVDLYNAEKDDFILFNPANERLPGSNSINWFYQDQNNTLFAGTNYSLNYFNEATRKFEKHEFPSQLNIKGKVTAMLQDRSGKYWLGTENGLYQYVPEDKSFLRFIHNGFGSLTDNQINTLFEDKNGRIWVGTRNGLNLYLGKNKGFKHYLNEKGNANSISFNFINCIQEDISGNIWVGTSEGGLNKLDPSSQTFIRFLRDDHDPFGLADNSVKDIMVDKNGALWITGFRGLNYQSPYQLQFDNLSFKAFDPGSLRDNFTTTIFKDSKGYIWVGNRNGISSFGPCSINFTHYTHQPGNPTSIADGAVLNISEDSEGNIWTRTHTKKFNKLNRERNTFESYSFEPPGREMNQEDLKFMYASTDGNIWVTLKDGIVQYDQSKNTISYHYIPDSIRRGGPSYLYEDRKGNFFVISRDQVYIFDKQKLEFSFADLIPEEHKPFHITQIYEDEDDNFWIGSTHHGLMFINPKENVSKLYRPGKDLPLFNIQGILKDNANQLWMGTNKGLARLDLLTGEHQLYTLSDGLHHNEFNLNAAVISEDGKMYFGGSHGISTFYPENILKNPHPPKVVFTNFELFNQAVEIGNDTPLKKALGLTKHIELDYTQSVLSFQFAALNYNSSEKNQYAYRMLGFEDEWNYSGTRRHVTYTNLAPGRTYTFQVKASNNDGVWNEEGTSIDIYITPPFWATWWFYSLMVIIVLGSTYALYRWRTRQLYMQRKSLERMVKERTVEVEAQKEKLAAHAQNLKSANKEIKSKNKEILKQAEKLRTIDDLKTKFLANISHEFRTPLTLILVPLEDLISKSKPNSETNRLLSMMDRNARRLLHLINQLLDLSKIEHGKLKLDLKTDDINSFVRSLALPFGPLAKKDEIIYELNFPNEEVWAAFDADKVEKIVYNLISNAFKFTQSKGKIEVCLEKRQRMSCGIQNTQHSVEHYVQISVRDSGQGIDSNHLPFIFDRFYQAEPSSARKSEGTGVGLALTKELVSMHHGEINVESTLGLGTLFVVKLPCLAEISRENVNPNAIEDDVANSAHGYLEEKPPESEIVDQYSDLTNLAQIEIPPLQADFQEAPLLLIVDDNDDLRFEIKRIFSTQFRVEEACNGNEGWSKALHHTPDIIISDVMMPEKDGLAFCKLLKNDPTTSHIPTILLSARTASEEAGLRCGADDYIIKPFKTNTLVLKVKNLMDSRQRFREVICKELGLEKTFTKDTTFQAKICSQDIGFIEKSIDIAVQHLSNPDFELERFYRELGMSRSLVYNKLKSLTGLGPNEFIRRIRLNKAAQLLQNEAAKISDVMEEVGFNHRSYFVKCFKNEFGHLPSEHGKETGADEEMLSFNKIEDSVEDKKRLARKLIQENN
jgi:signal transduction histidine kinase/ligand-binding sensor domain-containing protein/DNA-binding response OmpR family regulator